MRRFIHLPIYFCLLITGISSCTHSDNGKIPDIVKADHINIKTQIEYLEGLAVENPKDPDIFYKLARLYTKIKDVENTYTNIKRAVELDPKEGKYYFLLVSCFIQKSLYQDALDYLPKVSRDEITESEYSNLAADAYFYSGNYKKALRYLDQIIETSDHAAFLFWKRGYIYSTMKDTLQAISNYEKAMALDSTFTNPMIAVAEYKNASGAYNEAAGLLTKALRFDTMNKTLYFNLGLAHKGMENKKEAELYYEKALQYDSSYAEALYNVSIIYLQKEAFAKAEHYLKKLKLIRPDISNLDFKIAVALKAQGKNEEALNYFQKIDTSSINYNFAQLMIKKINKILITP